MNVRRGCKGNIRMLQLRNPQIRVFDMRYFLSYLHALELSTLLTQL